MIAPAAPQTDAIFRGMTGVVAAVVCAMTVAAIHHRGRVWADRGSAYMQLLFLSTALNLLQCIDAVLDVAWLLQWGSRDDWSWQDVCNTNATTNASTNASFVGRLATEAPPPSTDKGGCWIQRTDASLNYASISLLLVAFIVLTFFFLRLALRLRLPTADQAQLQEAQAVLKAPLFGSVAFVTVLWAISLSGAQPDAFTCRDPVWRAFLVSLILVSVVLLGGIGAMFLERRKRARGNSFWNALLGLAGVMLLATSVGVLETLDHVLRDTGTAGECLPLDATYSAAFAQELDPIARGILHFAGRVCLYSLPSVAILMLFRTGRPSRPRTVAISSSTWRRSRTSITETLLKVSPSGLDLAADFPETSESDFPQREEGEDRAGDQRDRQDLGDREELGGAEAA